MPIKSPNTLSRLLTTAALGLALVLRINAAFDSIEDDDVLAMKAEDGEPRGRRDDDAEGRT